jgi:transposase
MPDTHVPSSPKPKRRVFTAEHKRRIAQEASMPGASVSRIARMHDVNTNQVFKWKRQYLCSQTAPLSGATPLLPVILHETTVPARPARTAQTAQEGTIELHLPLGRVVLAGNVNTDVLRIVLHTLAR